MVFVICAILTGGATFRVAGGVFYGLGDAPSEDAEMAQMAAEETSETDSDRQRTPLTMIVPPTLLVACAAALGLITPLGPAVQAAAIRFQDQAGYTTIGALILAFLALYWRRLPLLRRGYEPGAGLTAPVQRFQSGVVNDYVTWMVLGLAGIGGVLALIIR